MSVEQNAQATTVEGNPCSHEGSPASSHQGGKIFKNKNLKKNNKNNRLGTMVPPSAGAVDCAGGKKSSLEGGEIQFALKKCRYELGKGGTCSNFSPAHRKQFSHGTVVLKGNRVRKTVQLDSRVSPEFFTLLSTLFGSALLISMDETTVIERPHPHARAARLCMAEFACSRFDPAKKVLLLQASPRSASEKGMACCRKKFTSADEDRAFCPAGCAHDIDLNNGVYQAIAVLDVPLPPDDVARLLIKPGVTIVYCATHYYPGVSGEILEQKYIKFADSYEPFSPGSSCHVRVTCPGAPTVVEPDLFWLHHSVPVATEYGVVVSERLFHLPEIGYALYAVKLRNVDPTPTTLNSLHINFAPSGRFVIHGIDIWIDTRDFAVATLHVGPTAPRGFFSPATFATIAGKLAGRDLSDSTTSVIQRHLTAHNDGFNLNETLAIATNVIVRDNLAVAANAYKPGVDVPRFFGLPIPFAHYFMPNLRSIVAEWASVRSGQPPRRIWPVALLVCLLFLVMPFPVFIDSLHCVSNPPPVGWYFNDPLNISTAAYYVDYAVGPPEFRPGFVDHMRGVGFDGTQQYAQAVAALFDWAASLFRSYAAVDAVVACTSVVVTSLSFVWVGWRLSFILYRTLFLILALLAFAKTAYAVPLTVLQFTVSKAYADDPFSPVDAEGPGRLSLPGYITAVVPNSTIADDCQCEVVEHNSQYPSDVVKDSLFSLGITFADFIPTVATTSFSNVYCAVVNRQLAIVPMPIVSVFNYWSDRFVPKLFEFLHPLVGNVDAPDFTNWNNRFPRHKQVRHTLALQQLRNGTSPEDHLILERESFGKVEKQLKREHYVPRLITGASQWWEVLFGPWVYALDIGIKRFLDYRNSWFLATATSSFELGCWFDNAHVHDDFSLAVCGDDQVIVLPLLNRTYYIHCDGSRHDSHMNHCFHDLKWLVYKRLLGDYWDEECEWFKKGQAYTNAHVMSSGIRYRHKNRVRSGDPDTTLGNSICTFFVAYVIAVLSKMYLLLGKTFAELTTLIVEAVTELGYTVKYNIDVEPYNVTFLSGLFVPVNGQTWWCPLPGRLLAKIGWTTNPNIGLIEFAGTIASFKHYLFVPFLGEYLRYSEGLLPVKMRNITPKFDYGVMVAGGVVPLQPAEDTWEFFLGRYSLDRSAALQFSVDLRRATTLPYLLKSKIFEVLCLVDVGLDEEV